MKCFEAALAVCIWRLHDVMSIKIRLTKINVIKAMPRAPILADDDLLSVALIYLFFVFVNVETSTVRFTRISATTGASIALHSSIVWFVSFLEA